MEPSDPAPDPVIRSFPSPTAVPPVVDPQLVSCIERLLARVQAGTVTAVAVVEAKPGIGCSTWWYCEGGGFLHNAIGFGLSVLHRRYLDETLKRLVGPGD